MGALYYVRKPEPRDKLDGWKVTWLVVRLERREGCAAVEEAIECEYEDHEDRALADRDAERLNVHAAVLESLYGSAAPAR